MQEMLLALDISLLMSLLVWYLKHRVFTDTKYMGFIRTGGRQLSGMQVFLLRIGIVAIPFFLAIYLFYYLSGAVNDMARDYGESFTNLVLLVPIMILVALAALSGLRQERKRIWLKPLKLKSLKLKPLKLKYLKFKYLRKFRKK